MGIVGMAITWWGSSREHMPEVQTATKRRETAPRIVIDVEADSGPQGLEDQGRTTLHRNTTFWMLYGPIGRFLDVLSPDVSFLSITENISRPLFARKGCLRHSTH